MTYNKPSKNFVATLVEGIHQKANIQTSAVDVDEENEMDSSIYPCSDIDSGVGEDVCDEHRETSENAIEHERKVIKLDVSAIRELTNFDEVK